MIKDRDEIIRKLVDIQYERNEIDFKRGNSGSGVTLDPQTFRYL